MKTCGEVMTRNVRTIASTATARDAALMMREQSLGFLPVVEPSSGRLQAVVTDRDLVVRMCAADARPSETPLSAVATVGPLCCYEGTDLHEAEDAMARQQFSRIVVVDSGGRPVGVLSLTDILMSERPRTGAQTARGVLSRQAGGPRTNPETLNLGRPRGRARRASSPNTVHPDGQAAASDNELPVERAEDRSFAARNREDVNLGGRETRGIKEFPR